MSASAFDTLLAAFVSKLGASPAASATIVTDSDEENPIPASKSDAINVSLVTAAPDRAALDGAPVNWDTDVKVECYATAAASSARAAANAIAFAAYGKLAADTSLGIAGVAIGPPQIEWAYFKGEKRTACATLTYSVMHRTENRTLT